MTASVGVREFRQGLAEFIDQHEPVTITRHGQTVGLFVPVPRDRRAELQAYAQAATKANQVLRDLGLTEDEVVSEFDSLRGDSHESAVQ